MLALHSCDNSQLRVKNGEKNQKNFKIRKKIRKILNFVWKSGEIRIIFWFPYVYGKICNVGNPVHDLIH